MQQRFHTIMLPTRPQPDTLVAILLLRLFGKEKYPGVVEAKIESMGTLPEGETIAALTQKGYFLLDVGGGPFDHHVSRQKVTASQLIADDLGITAHPAIAKLLQYAERDDKYGKGTISADPLDRAFGFSGLTAALNKSLPGDSQKVVELTLPLLLAHYKEERRRTEEIPAEFEKSLQEGNAEVFEVKGKSKKLKIVIITSQNPSLAGWLRSQEGLKADVVAQYLPSGHLNILTRPTKRIDLRIPAGLLRAQEIASRGEDLELPLSYLMRSGRIDEAPEWYYDRATNSLQNGGINPGNTPSTRISKAELKEILTSGFGEQAFQTQGEDMIGVPPAPPLAESQGSALKTYYLEMKLPQDAAKEISDLIQDASPGVRLHRPDNYHVTLMHFGKLGQDAVGNLIADIQDALKNHLPLTLSFAPEDFAAGNVPGYEEGKAFYFGIGDERGGNPLKNMRKALEEKFPHKASERFTPHLTVASVGTEVIPEVSRDAIVILEPEKNAEVLIKKIRLTAVDKLPDGRTVYRACHNFILGEQENSINPVRGRGR
ncbi:MAG: 2'-5' RNA ligase family protein [bacterium]|nr:2'-5' RNA ligase family protein [bacterium]